MGVLEDYARLTDGVQKVLDWRLFKLGDYQAAEKELRRARASGQKDQALDSVCSYSWGYANPLIVCLFLIHLLFV